MAAPQKTQRKFRQIHGQSIIELAVLLGAVITGLVVIQTYVRRSLQDRMHDSARRVISTTGGGASTSRPMQYEPYYLAGPAANTLISQSNSSVDQVSHFVVSGNQMTGTFTSNTRRAPGSFDSERPPRPVTSP